MDQIKTVLELDRWYQRYGASKTASYHRGFLARDREESQALDQLARVAMKMAENNLIDLVQRRIKKNNYIYMAIKRNADNGKPG